MNVSLVIAEVMDKEPPALELLAFGLVVAGVAFAACRWSRWLLIVFLPLSIFVGIGLTSEVRDQYVGPAILAEAGWSYVILAYLASVLPGGASLAGAALQWRRQKEKNRANQRPDGTAAKAPPSDPSQGAAVPHP